MTSQKITTFLMFNGNAEEALNFYTSIFEDAKIENLVHQKNGDVLHATFTLNGQTFMATDNRAGEKIPFTAAMSLFVTCDTDEEISSIYKQLSNKGKVLMALAATPFSVKFGWLEDQYGVSWQLTLEKSIES